MPGDKVNGCWALIKRFYIEYPYTGLRTNRIAIHLIDGTYGIDIGAFIFCGAPIGNISEYVGMGRARMLYNYICLAYFRFPGLALKNVEFIDLLNRN